MVQLVQVSSGLGNRLLWNMRQANFLENYHRTLRRNVNQPRNFRPIDS